MKKLLVVDPLSPIGHSKYNFKMLGLLSQIGEVTLAIKEGYWSNEQLEQMKDIQIKYIPEKYFNENQGVNKIMVFHKLRYRLLCLQTLNWVKSNFNFCDYDKIIFLSFETITMFLFTQCKNYNFYLINHNNISEILESKIKRILYARFSKSTTQIVLEPFIKNFLESMGINNRICIVRHPLTQYNKFDDFGLSTDKKYVFAPGGYNDEGFIRELIKKEAQINKKVHIVIKSSEQIYEGDNITVYKKWMPFEDFIKYNLNCTAYLIPFSNEFNYRVSNIIFDGFSRRKQVYLMRNNTLQYYGDTYLKTIKMFTNLDEFLISLDKIKADEELESDECLEYMDASIIDELIHL